MISQLTQLVEYCLLIFPGILFIALFLVVIPRSNHPFRIVAYIFLFLVIRDGMTPVKFWFIGSEGFFWMRWCEDGPLLIGFALLGPFVVLLINRIDKDLKDLLVWFKGDKFKGFIVGLAGALVCVLPFYVIYHFVPAEQRGGAVAAELLIPILLISVLGNFTEEVIFRGYLQGYFERIAGFSPLRAALASGVAFPFGHIHLAVFISGAGLGLLSYALLEGIIAGLVRMKYGVIPATLTHGFAIFLMTSGFLG